MNKKVTMNPRFLSFLRRALALLLITILLASVFKPQTNASAAAVLTVSPLTLNIVGLDSNNVNLGPNNFPVGGRVCNTGDAANVTATFVWDSMDA